MSQTMFFSWQADTPENVGRRFIEEALKNALTALKSNATVEPALRDFALDRDTQGVGGQPPIVDTVFRKIDSATIFVPDMTFVATRLDGRLSPNPNVLIEYGWALKSLGHPCIVAVMNSAYGAPDNVSMPFDMRHLRHPITYKLPEDANQEVLTVEFNRLVQALVSALQTVLNDQEFITIHEKRFLKLQFQTIQQDHSISRFRPPNVPLGILHQRAGFSAPQDIYLQDGPAMWLRLVPQYAQSKITARNLDQVTDNHHIIDGDRNPFEGWHHNDSAHLLRADDGYGCYRVHLSGSPVTFAASFIFLTGELWSINTERLFVDPRDPNKHAIPFLENEYATALDCYRAILQEVGIRGPYRWIAGMERIRGRGIEHWSGADNSRSPHGVCVSEAVSTEGTLTESQSSSEALQTFFNLIFERCAVDRDQYLARRQEMQQPKTLRGNRK